MKVRVRRVSAEDVPVAITTEFIKLESFLKLANAVPSGGMAKNFIQNGEVLVNGEPCTMRGKKLRPGDDVRFDGVTYCVRACRLTASACAASGITRMRRRSSSPA